VLVVEITNKSGPRTIAANQPNEIDLGDYTVVVRARGYSEFMSRVKISQEAKTTTVEATLRPGASNADAVGVGNPERDRDESAPGSTRKIIAISAMAAGGAALVGGIVFGSLAKSKWSEAKDVCGGTTCMTQDQVDQANALGDQARSKATLSTVFVLSGVAIGGVGAYLWFTTPKGTTITPTASDTGAGVTISGRF